MKRSGGLQSLKAVLFILKRENFFYILGVTLVVLLGGAISFYFLERGSNKTVEGLGSAVYWAIISMTTTGYGDISPSTAGGRVVAVIMVIAGLLLLSLVTATVASVFVEKKIREGKGLEPVKLEDHIVLCGWNSNAEDVIAGLLRSLPEKKIRLVLVNELPEDKMEALKYKYREHGFKFLRGDFAHEEVLERVNITKARSAIILADTSGQFSLEKADEHTILGTLAVKSLAPEVKTCAELLNPENRQHLKRANVDEIVVRGEHLGNLLASATVSPGLPRVFSLLLSPEEENKMWKVEIPSSYIGKTAGELATYFRDNHQALLFALLGERKGLVLDKILTDDYSAIDQFIKRKFEEADRDFFGKKERVQVVLNPANDVVIGDEDAAVVLARKRP
jgi:voltage-gated potassium channel